jgi:Fe-S-cluster containining protein
VKVPHNILAGDRELVQILDTALADATRRSGSHLVCRKGCTQCCIGVFAISQLDALRLQRGLAELAVTDPERAARVRERGASAAARLAADFPGDAATGVLDEGEEADARFADYANDEPCPVLDPVDGTCDLYASRPITCRAFGPPIRSEQGLGVCELCFHGATDEQIAACEMEVDPGDLEPRLLAELERSTGAQGQTIIAFATSAISKDQL